MSWSWIVTVAVVAIVALFLSGGITMIMGLLSKFGKILSDAAGAADALASLAEEQLQTCKDHGYFNIGKGCVVGFGFIGYVSSVIMLWVGKNTGATNWLWDKTSKKINRTSRAAKDNAVRLGVTAKEVTDEMLRQMRAAEERLKTLGYSQGEPVFEVTLELLAAKTANKLALKVANEKQDPTEKKEAIESCEAQTQAIEKRAKTETKDMSAREQTDVEKNSTPVE